MKLEGKIFKANLLVQSATVQEEDTETGFASQLERCLILLCRQMSVPIPLWMKKNTREFARFHQTVFFAEQFAEPICFDRFQIRWLE